MFSALNEFGWSPIKEDENIVGLNKGGKNITLEPGNQIELSGENLIIFTRHVQSLMIICLNLNKSQKNLI